MDLAELGRQSGTVHRCRCEEQGEEWRGPSLSSHRRTGPWWPNSTRKEDLSLQYLTAVIERPSNTNPCLPVTVYPWPYDRNPLNSDWTAYGLRVHTAESWKSAMDPTLIPARRKNQQDDGGDPVREVRRPRLNDNDKGEVYLERIGTKKNQGSRGNRLLYPRQSEPETRASIQKK